MRSMTHRESGMERWHRVGQKRRGGISYQEAGIEKHRIVRESMLLV